MSEEKRSTGSIVSSWWSRNIGNREISGNRALAARLRRAEAVEVLGERAVVDLARQLGLSPGPKLDRFISMVRLIAEVRTNDAAPLARRVGGADPVLSEMRFQRLLRANGAEFEDLMRRALMMADRKCNVAALGGDLLHWRATVRQRWCFQYFGAETPDEQTEEKQA